MNIPSSAETVERFATSLPVTILSRPKDDPDADWQEFDKGPGIFFLSPDQVFSVRIRGIDGDTLRSLVQELAGCKRVISLNLSENRNIYDDGLEYLKDLPHLTQLNLSSCSITSTGMVHLAPLTHLTHLDLSFCNRITDAGLKHLKALTRLTNLNLQGCVKTTHAGTAKIQRRGLIIRS
jgi:hypothetical protein